MYNMTGNTISKRTFCDALLALARVLGSGVSFMQVGNNNSASDVISQGVAFESNNDCALALQSVRAKVSKVILYGTQTAALQMGVSSVNEIAMWCANNNDQIPAEITNQMQEIVDYVLFICAPDTQPYTDGTLTEKSAIIARGVAISIISNYLALKYSLTVYAPLVSAILSMTCPTSEWVNNAMEPPSYYL